MHRLIVASALALAALLSPQLAAAGDAPAAAAAASRPDPNQIRPDPAVRRGVLANGLRYAVMSNPRPTGGLSLRLGMDVGSFDEREDERGAAHFVEHMVFNGSRNFPEGDVDKIFQPLGVAFGQDQNAATGLFATVYGLDLHTTAAQPVDTAFRWLRDVADGALFSPDAVNRERGVILAERESDLTPVEATREALMQFYGKGLRSTDRDPIGTLDTLRKLDAPALRAFYKRWYRPQNATVVVVGDLPVEVLEKKVAEAFSSWTAEGPAPQRAPRGAPKGDRGLEVLTRTEPNAPTLVDACRLRPADPLLPDDVAGLRRRTAGEIWRRALQARLARAAQDPQSGLLSVDVDLTDESREAARTCVSAVAVGDRWRDALATMTAELRRFAAYGPTDRELETVVEQIRSLYRGAVGAAETRDTVGLAQMLVESGLTGAVIPSPREAFRAYDQAVEDLTPADVKAAFARDWSGDGPLVTVVSPSALQPTALAEAWAQDQAAPVLAQYKDPEVVKWAYASFGKPGAVARREVEAVGGFVRYTFGNGVVLNFKHTGLERGEVLVDVRFGRGQADIANRDTFLAQMAASAFKLGGLGKHSVEELYGQFPAGAWDAELSIDHDAFRLRGGTNAVTLDRQIAILAAYMSDPGFRPSIDSRLAASMQATYRSYATSPEMVVSMALNKALDPASGGLPTEAEAARMRAKDFERVLKPIILNSPLEVNVVGDADEAAVVEMVAKTFGALPRRNGEPQGPVRQFIRVPQGSAQVIRATHEGSAEKAVASLVWPLYVATPERRREEMAINLMAEVFNNSLRRRIREDLGKSYAPQAGTVMPDKADQGLLTAVIETYPADVDDVVAETRRLAKSLAAGQITQADLEEARQPMLTRMSGEEGSNQFWLDVISGSSVDPQRAPDIVGLDRLIASIRLDEVQKAAADWLSKDPIVVVATPKSAPAQTAQVAP